MTRRTFELVVVDQGGPDDPPVIRRLRAFLKMALRSYALRCESARELPAEGVDPGAPPRLDCGDGHRGE